MQHKIIDKDAIFYNFRNLSISAQNLLSNIFLLSNNRRED